MARIPEEFALQTKPEVILGLIDEAPPHDVDDRTQQAANSARNRRATVVTESSQAESGKLSVGSSDRAYFDHLSGVAVTLTSGSR